MFRRGLDRGYRELTEETRRPRGKLDLPRTARRALRVRGQVSVRYEELSRDVLHNRIVKSTMQRLAAVEELNPDLKGKLTRLVHRIADIADVDLRDDLFRRVQVHRNNADYGFILDLCRLITRHLVPENRIGAVRFKDFTADDARWAACSRPSCAVSSAPSIRSSRFSGIRRIYWDWTSVGDDAKRFPIIETDIYVPGHRGPSVVIEAKCVSSPFATNRRTGTVSLRSDHLYQMFAYLRNDARSFPGPSTCTRRVGLRYSWGCVRLSILRAQTSAVDSVCRPFEAMADRLRELASPRAEPFAADRNERTGCWVNSDRGKSHGCTSADLRAPGVEPACGQCGMPKEDDTGSDVRTG